MAGVSDLCWVLQCGGGVWALRSTLVSGSALLSWLPRPFSQCPSGGLLASLSPVRRLACIPDGLCPLGWSACWPLGTLAPAPSHTLTSVPLPAPWFLAGGRGGCLSARHPQGQHSPEPSPPRHQSPLQSQGDMPRGHRDKPLTVDHQAVIPDGFRGAPSVGTQR